MIIINNQLVVMSQHFENYPVKSCKLVY